MSRRNLYHKSLSQKCLSERTLSYRAIQAANRRFTVAAAQAAKQEAEDEKEGRDVDNSYTKRDGKNVYGRSKSAYISPPRPDRSKNVYTRSKSELIASIYKSMEREDEAKNEQREVVDIRRVLPSDEGLAEEDEEEKSKEDPYMKYMEWWHTKNRYNARLEKFRKDNMNNIAKRDGGFKPFSVEEKARAKKMLHTRLM